MKIYHYNPDDGGLLGHADADNDPVVKGEFLIPANATDISPPEFEEDEIPVFVENEWSLVPDLRGKKLWLKDGTEITIETLGELPPANALAEAPILPVYASAEEAIGAMVDWIGELCASITGPVPQDEKNAWGKKEAAARAIVADEATNEQKLLLQSEAEITGETLADLALIIKNKAEYYERIIGLVSGLRRKTEAAIKAEAEKPVPDAYQYEAFLEQAKAYAETLLASLPK